MYVYIPPTHTHRHISISIYLSVFRVNPSQFGNTVALNVYVFMVYTGLALTFLFLFFSFLFQEDRRRGEMLQWRAVEVDALLSSLRAGL